MAIVEFFIGKSKYKIECPESEQNKLLHLAKKLNERVQKLAPSFAAGDEKTLLVITALMMEDAIELGLAGAHNHATEEEKLSENDIYDAISENLENIADYVENLAKKIEHY